MDQVKEQNYAQKKNKPNGDSQLSDAELTTLVTRMLRELTEYRKIIMEEMKSILSEIKNNLQGTNNEGTEAGVQINDLENKEEINIQPELKEARIKKNKERQRTKMAA